MKKFKQYAWFLVIASQVMGCVDYIDPDEPEPFLKPRTYGRYNGPDRVPDIEVQASLDFDLSTREASTKPLLVRNVGRSLLNVESLELEGVTGFRVDTQGPLEIAPGEFVQLQVTLEPAEGDTQLEDVLLIRSDDPDEPRVEVRLTAQVPAPCLDVSPSTIDFGEVTLGGQVTSSFLVRNCSETLDTTYTVYSLQDIDGGSGQGFGGAFSVSGRVDERVVLAPGESLEIDATFFPFGVGSFQDIVRVDIEGAPQQQVTLLGIAKAPPEKCVETLISANPWPLGPGDFSPPIEGTHNARPLESLLLSGAASSSSEGLPLDRMEWTLVSKPTDSTTLLEPQGDDRTLYLDLAGEYVIELNIWDAEGNPSCEPERVIIRAIPEEYLHVQLVWDTPNDPDQTDDIGADMDLHLARRQDQWDSQESCNWQSLSPEWGVFNDPSDDPSLDIDDIDGSGPENINLDVIEPNTRYRVGVHAFDWGGYGSSWVTVRVYVGGQLLQELSGVRLRNQEFLHAMDLTFDNGIPSVDVRNQVSSTFP